MRIYVGPVAGIAAVALGFGAVGAAEFNDFVQPSAIACHRAGADFGPPPGCGDGSQPHNRTVFVTALSTSTSLTMNSAHIVYDAEHFQPDGLVQPHSLII
jgi:hypothetical protein